MGVEARLFLERDQKRDQAKSKAFEIFSANLFFTIRAPSRFFTRATPLVAPKLVKGVIFYRNELHGTRLVFPSLPYWVFFTPTLRVYADGRRSVYRFPIFYSYGASLRARHYTKIFGDNNLRSGGRQCIFRCQLAPIKKGSFRTLDGVNYW